MQIFFYRESFRFANLSSPSCRLKSDSDSVSQTPERGDPQIPVDGAKNQLVAKFSRLYAQAALEDQLAL
jgi:hypothetical protein